MELNLSLTNSQAKFLELQQKALYCLYKGGYGAGKTFMEVTSAFLDSTHSPEANIGIFAPTIGDAREVPMTKMIELLEKHLGLKEGKDWERNKNEMTIKSLNPMFGNFYFKSMEDPDRIVGYEFYTIHIDELDTLPAEKAEKAWDKIIGRARQWPKGLPQSLMQWNPEHKNANGTKGRWEPRNKVCAYTTPEGFRFTHKQWSNNKDDQYKYLEVDSRENPHLPGHYIEGLKKKYKGPQLEAYLQGKWCNMESGTVYYSFDRTAKNSTEVIRNGESLFIGMDFNVGKMAACVFVKRKGGREWHCVDEIVDVLDTPDIISVIKERYPNHPITVYPDATGKSRDTGNASISDISLLKTAGFIVRAKSKNPFVKDRVSAVNKAFMDCMLYVNTELCPTVTDCLEQQSYDKAGKPSKESGHDHSNDAFGYPIAFELPLRKPLFAVPIRWIA